MTKDVKDATESTPQPRFNAKASALKANMVENGGEPLTTNTGLRVSDDHNSLRLGARGPTLLEDHMLREKITHFDHERIPERVVHARGTGAFGEFECYEDCSAFTKAGLFSAPGKRTPVLARFSTVVGSRGSADTVRDVRGFSVKFYTEEGNWDFVGNNIPVFFIQDAIKFPDLIHAAKPEQHNEIPQAQTAHDTFWDFISLMPESMHMIMWTMSDRAIPRSYRTMEGFGVHTFRFVNATGEATFVKFHWKPLAGIHGLAWDEASKLAGKDPDFHRRDLWESIEAGLFPEYELGVQLVPESEEFAFDFDLLDATKLIPEELVPVQRIGKLTLNRNPDNFFAEIEQVAFHPGHLVPGIDLSNDPLLQGRLFSYLDTQISRLGGPNFNQIPVNKPLVPVRNNQRDGMHQHRVDLGEVAYEPARIGKGCPFHSPEAMGSYVNHPAREEGAKVRVRPLSFGDHFSQARLFLNSLSAPEQDHLAHALQFELGKVARKEVRERVVGLLAHVDGDLARVVARKIGLASMPDLPVPPNPADPRNNIVPQNASLLAGQADDAAQRIKQGPAPKRKSPATSAALSMVGTGDGGIRGRKFALLIADGVDADDVETIKKHVHAGGAVVETVSLAQGKVETRSGGLVEALRRFDTNPSLTYDGVLIAGGAASVEALSGNGDALHFVAEAFKHCKTIAAFGEGAALLAASPIPSDVLPEGVGAKADVSHIDGVVFGTDRARVLETFIEAAGRHRHWTRKGIERTPA